MRTAFKILKIQEITRFIYKFVQRVYTTPQVIGTTMIASASPIKMATLVPNGKPRNDGYNSAIRYIIRFVYVMV